MNKIFWIGILVLIGCAFFSINLFGEEPKMKIAVLDLDKMSDDVSVNDVRILSDSVRDAIIKTGKLKVVSANEYNSPDVKRAIMGSISRSGNTYLISLKLINLETTEYITTESIQGTNQEDSINKIYSKADILAGKSKTPAVPILSITGYSLIGVSAVCTGLGIFFNYSAQNSYDSAMTAYQDFKNNSSDAKWQSFQNYVTQAEQNLSYRNIFYIAGGISLGAGLVCVLTPLFLPENNLAVVVTPNQLTVCYRF